VADRIRFQFSKGEEVRFLSHLDLLRTLQRALRRAELPIAYSGGFSPKPLMSFGPALPVGICSVAEYGDFEFSQKTDPKEFTARLNSTLPAGLRVIHAVSLPAGSPALMRVINAAEYEIILAAKTPAEIEKRLAWLFGRDTFLVKRETKKRNITLNALPLLLEKPKIKPLAEGSSLTCRLAVGQAGNLRLGELGSMLEFDYREVQITRTALLIKEGEKYRVPIEN